MARVLEGIRVIDFTNNVAGPCCTAMLADMGAEVIKIERPVAGDDSRGNVPRLEGKSLNFNWYNRGKKSVELFLKDPEAVELILKMIADADVVVESYKPGQMKKYGLDYEAACKVNPKIIYCSISACGQTGAYAWRPGFDVIAQGMSGFMDMQGDPDGDPVKSGVTVGDYVGAFNAYGAIMTALYYRQNSGEGQFIDISLLDGLVSIMTPIEGAATLDLKPTRAGRHHNTLAPYGIYRSDKGESVIIAAFSAGQWSKLCSAIGRPDLLEDERFASIGLRAKNIKDLEAILQGWLSSFDTIEQATDILDKAGVACCKIKSVNEVAHDQALWDRGSLTEIELPPSFTEHRTYKARGPWIQYSKTPMEMRRAPDLGEHNYELLGKYGWSKEKVDEREAQWSSSFKKQ
ncbi:MAG: CoA transferase [Eubacteriales bacterium]|nr:CoA transferase [Eubacteriales bacterium]